LKLAHNKISEFLSADFPGLEELQMQNNELTGIDEIKEEHLQKLIIFNLENNFLVRLPTMHLQSVEKLQLKGNQI
jgi:Leucine-rich repeat (LRR) protein